MHKQNSLCEFVSRIFNIGKKIQENKNKT